MDAKTETHQKIKAITAPGPMRLHVQWERGPSHDIDLTQFASAHAALSPIACDFGLFSKVEVGDWGWCAHWTDEIEVSAATLWCMALKQDGDDFRKWRKDRGMTQDGIAEALGLSLRMVKYYEAGTHAIPKTVKLAMAGFDAVNAAE